MPRRKRHDPPSTAADGYRALDALTNRDPDLEYVFANPNDVECGVPMYLTIPGAHLVLKSPDGPRLVIGDGVAEGQVVTRMGMQLVAYPKQYKLDQDAAVHAKALGFDKRVLKDGNVDDPMRGKHSWGRSGVDRNETQWALPRGE